jgi:uncharacterized OB-fold protein
MERTRVPAVEGWFTLDDPPHLIGTRCSKSGTVYFPPERTRSRAPGCADAELEEIELSRTGRLWSYTNAGYKPPEPFVAQTDPFEPFCIAAVELDAEKIVVLGQCVEGVRVDDLEVGLEMELVLDVLDRTEDADVMIWKWQPVGWTGGAS